MRILITGGGGFIGKNLTLRLLKENHQVVVVDNFITSSEADSKPFLKLKKIRLFKGDITDSRLIQRIGKSFSFDQIYHLACPTGVPNLGPLAFEMLMTCSLGTKNILDLAKAQKAKILFTSSSEIYGDPEVFPQSESYSGNVDPVGFRSPYEEGKRFSESLVKMYCNKFNLDGRIVRIFNTYGPFMSLKDSRVIPNFLQSANKGEALTVKGKGEQKRTFCYVDDLISGFLLIMEKGKRGEVYNLGGEKEIKIVDLARMILDLTGGRGKIKFIKRESHDHQSRRPDLKKVKKLGWRSRISLQKGLKDSIKFIESNEMGISV